MTAELPYVQCDYCWGDSPPQQVPDNGTRCPHEAELFYHISCTPNRRETMEVARRLGRDLYISARCPSHPRSDSRLFERREITKAEYIVAEVMES